MGGKVRLRKWLVSHFPASGNKYVEPFAGRGNVFFQARKDLRFMAWHISDVDVSFFTALRDANLDDLPARVTKSDFNVWKTSTSPVAKLIESRITFAGKGYRFGFDGGDPSHPPYRGDLYKPLCEEARRLLADVHITEASWDQWDYDSLTADDFVYFDPPYYGTNASYPNIDHEKLVRTINGLRCRWALSGYDNAVYKSLKFTGRYVRERNSEIKGSNSRRYEPVTEVIWLSGR